MSCAYPDGFRQRAVSLIRTGQTVKKTTSDLCASCAILHLPVSRDKIGRGEVPGVPLAEPRELRKARMRVHEFENEVETLRRAQYMLGSQARHPKGFTQINSCSGRRWLSG